MATLAVRRTETWQEVEQVAGTTGVLTCIRPTLANWERAKNTWENYALLDSPEVLYFTVYLTSQGFGIPPTSIKGYIRLLKASYASDAAATWVVDFVRPNLYTPIVLAAQEIQGTVLAPKFSTEDDIVIRGWPTITVAFPKLADYPYHLRIAGEYTYLVVPKYA